MDSIKSGVSSHQSSHTTSISKKSKKSPSPKYSNYRHTTTSYSPQSQSHTKGSHHNSPYHKDNHETLCPHITALPSLLGEKQGLIKNTQNLIKEYSKPSHTHSHTQSKHKGSHNTGVLYENRERTSELTKTARKGRAPLAGLMHATALPYNAHLHTNIQHHLNPNHSHLSNYEFIQIHSHVSGMPAMQNQSSAVSGGSGVSGGGAGGAGLNYPLLYPGSLGNCNAGSSGIGSMGPFPFQNLHSRMMSASANKHSHVQNHPWLKSSPFSNYNQNFINQNKSSLLGLSYAREEESIVTSENEDELNVIGSSIANQFHK